MSRLQFSKEGRFRILMVSDAHWNYRKHVPYTGEMYRERQRRIVDGIERLLAWAKPDFVLLGGDQCLGADTEEEMQEEMEKLLAPVLKRGLPWAAVFGNHDREQNHSLETEQRAYEKIPGCLSAAGPEDLPGVGNYCLEVFSSREEGVACHIWGLDSLAESKRDFVQYLNLPQDTRFVLPRPLHMGCGYAGVTPKQVFWYYRESERREREAGKKIPAVMFMHIPLPELCTTVRNPAECNLWGMQLEKPCPPELNSGMFMACLQRGDVKGIFFGHEHSNAFDSEYCGITLGYDGTIGYDMNGTTCYMWGGRVIDLTEDGGFSTRFIPLMRLMKLEDMGIWGERRE
ncbi:MAG: metallophosphoesterase [Roseburia sp.]|nr:metallophosphoesterase [Roseburia sp.]MCM1098162.1 metallophosphoesterase [Ruminococcus flavefaciens]